MLNDLYKNIGGKIKNWAKWIFIVEAIGAVITGIYLIFKEFSYGILILIFGPIVAYVGSWILYALGEITEDIHAMRNKYSSATEEIAFGVTKEKSHGKAEENAEQTSEPPKENKKENTDPTTSAMFYKKNTAAPYWCGKCGYDGPYENNCPNCNSSLKVFNTK